MKLYVAVFFTLVVCAAADFDKHTFEEENKMLGMDPNGIPLDNIDEMDLQNYPRDVDDSDEDNDDGSGSPERQKCKRLYNKCRESFFNRIFQVCKKKFCKCCADDFKQCRLSSISLINLDGCTKKMFKCRNQISATNCYYPY